MHTCPHGERKFESFWEAQAFCALFHSEELRE